MSVRGRLLLPETIIFLTIEAARRRPELQRGAQGHVVDPVFADCSFSARRVVRWVTSVNPSTVDLEVRVTVTPGTSDPPVARCKFQPFDTRVNL